jgi:hypothetical protein
MTARRPPISAAMMSLDRLMISRTSRAASLAALEVSRNHELGELSLGQER